MFQPIVLILFASGFTVAQKKELLCRSDDLEISFSTCGDHSTGPFTFGAEPCSFKGNSRWKGSLFWIPKADINVLTGCVRLWHANSKVLEWKGALCKGVDDDYSFCGALKGEFVLLLHLSGTPLCKELM
ncbi:lymphocyte antigen 96 isoform X3 [Hemicordylus capensis]|uniref:lymphocyte antigen 96 isoform X3 n=1 Tax=Hemicordylus capensis TaxID=884348 RepID=UPI002302C1AD|nr:lymphocyte antigen 96 isoform X3 [Hemicordylus capensis]